MTGLLPEANKGVSSRGRFMTTMLSGKGDGGAGGEAALTIEDILCLLWESLPPSRSLSNFMALNLSHCLCLPSLYCHSSFSYLIIVDSIIISVLTVATFLVVFLVSVPHRALEGFRQQLFPLSVSHSSLLSQLNSDEPCNSLHLWEWVRKMEG